MKIFASKEAQSEPTACTYAHHRQGVLQRRHLAETRRILYSKGAQARLTVGPANDEYEQEADRVSNTVMRMSNADVSQRARTGTTQEIQIQRTFGGSNEVLAQPQQGQDEQTIQAKGVNGQSQRERSKFASQINTLKSGGQPLNQPARDFFEPRFGHDFSGVRIHQDGQAADISRSVNARAFTLGNHVVFGAGQYQPQSSEGKRLLGHELTHVLQQNSCANQRKTTSIIADRVSRNPINETIQRYFEATGTVSGDPYRVSDDMTAAVKVGYPNHDFYAKQGKVAIANASLTGVASGIELIEESTSFKVSQGNNKKTLKKVMPSNKQNATSGDTMKLWDDCGDSAGVVVGGTTRTALHFDAMTGSSAKTVATSPSLMKAEIMKKLMDKWLSMPSTSAAAKKIINDTIAAANAKQLEIDAAEAAYAAATTDAERETIGDTYWARVDEYGNIMMSYYNSASEEEREEYDKYLEINKFTNPKVGQGYTMSSGGTNYPGEKTWNFHWGGVVMKSDDNKDNITLENYAMGGDTKVQNDKWDFAMYGTEKNKQTFHEQHHDTKQHGDKPTTMTIEEK